MARLPVGSKASFARLCGFSGRHHLRAVGLYNAYLTEKVAKRIEARIDACERGEFVIVDTGRRGRFPFLEWEAKASRGTVRIGH